MPSNTPLSTVAWGGVCVILGAAIYIVLCGTYCIYVTMHSILPTHTIQNHPALGRHNHKHHLMLIWLLFSHFNWLSSQVVCSVNYINCGRGSQYSLSHGPTHDPSRSHSPCSILYMAQVCCHTASLLVLCIGCRMLQ